jgi:hypothetical protein
MLPCHLHSLELENCGLEQDRFENTRGLELGPRLSV